MVNPVRLLRRPLALFLCVWAGLFVAALAWAAATPLGGSPDEPAHIVKAASVARGQFIGEPTDLPAVRRVLVPEGIASAPGWACYAFDATESASCLRDIPDGSGVRWAETSSGLYNPAFYFLVGWPSLLTGDASVAVMGMRAFGALIVTCFFAAGFMALRQLWPNRATALGFAAAVTPMVLFLASAVNPNALEVASGFALLTALLLVLGHEPVTRRWPWLLLIGIAGVLLTQARAISPLWMAVIGLIVLILTPWPRVMREVRRPSVISTIVVLTAGVVVAIGWTLSTGTLGSMGDFPGATDSPRRAFVLMLLRTFDPGLIGYFGWLDAPAPAFVYALWSSLAFVIVIGAVAVAGARGLLGLGIAATALLVLPAVVQALSVQSSGYIWQGRYALIAYVSLIAVATLIVGANIAKLRPRIGGSGRLTWTIATLVIIGHTWALLAALQRSQGGLEIDQMILNPRWTPPGGIVLWLLVLVLGVAFAAFAVLAGTSTTSSTRPGDATPEDSYGEPVVSEKGL